MTLPLYLAAHLAFGVAMGHVMFRRMLAEGEVVGIPLIATMGPVGLITAPLGAVLLRYAGGWFLHGALIGAGSIGYERFHLGIILLVGVGAAVFTLAGLFVAIAALSRDAPAIARSPLLVSVLAAALVLVLDGRGVLQVAGTNGRLMILHPVGAVSLLIVGVMAGAVWYARRKLSTPPQPTRGGPASSTPTSPTSPTTGAATA